MEQAQPCNQKQREMFARLVEEAKKRSARIERKRSLKKYDLAILGVWSAETAGEAKGIVEALL